MSPSSSHRITIGKTCFCDICVCLLCLTIYSTNSVSPLFLSLRESLKAEAVGLTWYEWWEHRTEEDVLRDEAELLEEVEYDSDSDCINDDVSEGPDDFHF